MSIETLLRLEMDLFALAVLATIAGTIVIRSREHRFMDAQLFLNIIVSLIAILVFDAIGWTLDGRPGRLCRFFLSLADTLYFALNLMPASLFLVYVDHFTAPERPLFLSPYTWFALGGSAMGAILAFVSPLKGLLFTLSADNVYIRGPLLIPLNIVNAFIGLMPLYILIRRKNAISSASFYNLILYPVLPLIGGLLQQLIYGTNLMWPATVSTILLTFINVQNRQIDCDYLTGVFNRSSLHEYLTSLIRKANEKRLFSGILLDLNYFKAINDTFGHLVGDQALIETAEILRASVRRTDFVARFGGDEFIVILETGSEQALEEVAGRIRNKMEAANSPKKPYVLSASIGKAVFDLKGDANLDTFVHRLDRLMYDDKARLAAKS